MYFSVLMVNKSRAWGVWAALVAAVLTSALTSAARAQVVTYYPGSGNLILSDSGTNYNSSLVGIGVSVASSDCLPTSGTVTQLSDWTCSETAAGGVTGYYMNWGSLNFSPSDALAQDNYTIAQLPAGLSALSFGYSYHSNFPPPGSTTTIGPDDTSGAVVFTSNISGNISAVVNIARSVPSEVDWSGPSSGTWNTATNWTPAGGGAQRVPLATDTASFIDPSLAGTVWLSGSQTVGSLWFDSANSYTIAAVVGGGTLGLASNANIWVDAGLHTLSAPLTVSGSLTVSAGPSLSPNSLGITLSGPVSGTGPLVMAGPCVLSLSNTNNTYSGGTVITGGTLIAAGAGSLGASGPVSLANATLDFSSSGSLAQPVSLTGAGVNTIEADAGTMTLSGSISGSGGLTKTGNGILALSNSANSYSGGTVINGGTLTAAGSGCLGSGGTVSIANATLDFSSSGSFAQPVSLTGAGPNTIEADAGTVTLNGVIGGSGGLTKTGNGILALSNLANSYNGGTAIAGGTLIAAGTGSLGIGGSVSIANATLDFSSSGNFAQPVSLMGAGSNTIETDAGTLNLSGAISGSDGLTKTGSGILALSNSANSYNGSTNVSAGTLQLQAAAVLSSTAAVSINSGAALDLDSFDLALANLSGGTVTNSKASTTAMLSAAYVAGAASYSSVIKDGGGKVAISVPAGGALTLANSANGYSGGTFVSGGQLNLAADGDLGTVPEHPSTNLTLVGGTVYATGSFTLAQNRQVSLTSDSVFDVPAGQTLTVDGAITGGGGLTLVDSGSLILAGTNDSYTGGTTVEGGTLAANNAGAIPPENSLTVAAGGTFVYDPSVDSGAGPVSSEVGAAAVPEPGTLALIVGGSVLAIGWAARRRKR